MHHPAQSRLANRARPMTADFVPTETDASKMFAGALPQDARANDLTLSHPLALRLTAGVFAFLKEVKHV